MRYRANNLIAKAKINFFKSSIENNQSDSKSLWKSLKQLGLPSKKGQPSCNIGINIDGKIKVSENYFYTTVADKLVSKLPSCVNRFGSSFVFNFYSSKGLKSKKMDSL